MTYNIEKNVEGFKIDNIIQYIGLIESICYKLKDLRVDQ